MRAFVTGGTGLIGGHIADLLLDRGWDVTVLARDASRAGPLQARGARVVLGDVTKPTFGRELLGIDVVFHCAAWYEVGVRDRSAMRTVNVVGTENVLRLAREQDVSRVIYTTTAGLFPSASGQALTEGASPVAAFDDPYVATKLEAHRLVAREMQAGRPVTIVAPGAVFGPWDTNQLAQSLALLVQGRLTILPTGFGLNTWTHAADVAEGHLLAATVGRPGEMYFLGDRVLSMYAFLEAAAHAAGVEPPRRRVPMALARMVAPLSELRSRATGRTPMLAPAILKFSRLNVVVDSVKARRELGWSPRPFEERLRDTMAWFVSEYREKRAPLPVKRAGASASDRPRRA